MTSHFRELTVWRLSMDLAKEVYALAAQFPCGERFELSRQVQRAAVSIPSNIAEGNARGTTRDYARFVAIAHGSLAELQTQLQLAVELELCRQDAAQPVQDLTERVGQMLLKLRQALERRANGSSRVPGPGSRGPEPGSGESADASLPSVP
jgi:four helix bundle protein